MDKAGYVKTVSTMKTYDTTLCVQMWLLINNIEKKAIFRLNHDHHDLYGNVNRWWEVLNKLDLLS